ncbi:MAG: hypothetical protein DME23_05750 [Verrucomicrobia bacterium]|nr:MAG: hypothetical protein DME23_05750 [Verrucomicrobiota bacterium]
MERATIFYSDKSRWTDNELMSLPRDGRKYELIEGELLMSPVGMTHSLVCLNLATLLIRFVQRNKPGKVFDSMEAKFCPASSAGCGIFSSWIE